MTIPPISRRRFLRQAAGAAGSVVAGVSLADLIAGRAAATTSRDPAIVRSWGGLIVPPTGVYWGADDTIRGFTGSKGIERQLGRRMAIRSRAYPWLTPCPSSQTVADAGLAAPKIIPMCSFSKRWRFPTKTPGWAGTGDPSVTSFGQGLDRIAAGEFDAYWEQSARGLMALGTPVIIRLWMEMNSKDSPYASVWQGGVGIGEASFIAAWRHVHDVFSANGATLNAGGPCIFVFCPQRLSTSGSWKAYWPGDEFVDWMGLDLYRTTFTAGTQTPADDMDTYDWAVAHTMPFMVCEAGFTQGKVVTTTDGRFDKDGTKTGHSLITDTRQQVLQHPQCVAYVHWNNVGPVANDYIDTSAKSLAHYRAFATDPAYALVRT